MRPKQYINPPGDYEDITEAIGGVPAVLSGDVAGIEAITGTGVAVRTASDTWTVRTLTGTTNQVTVTNGDGVSGNPTFSLPQSIHTGATPTFDGLSLTSWLNLAADAATTTEGDLWRDSTQKSIGTYLDGMRQDLLGVIFTQTADGVVGNTGAETTILGTGVGTLTLPAGFFVAGKTIRVTVMGILSDAAAAPTVNFKLKLGSTTICSTGAVTLTQANMVNKFWKWESEMTCRTTGATGTVMGAGMFHINSATNTARTIGAAGTAAVTVDTTATQTIDLTLTWGTADVANTATSQVASVEVLK